MKKKGFWILLAVFVVLIAGASVLYTKLSGSVENPSLVAAEQEKEDADAAAEEGDADASPEEENTDAAAEEENTGASPEEENTDAAPKEDKAQEVPLAPDFTVYDAEGNAVSLSDFLGTPVIVNFWASWCGPCKKEMPDFEAAYRKYKSEIQFMMVNLTDNSQETVEVASEFIEEQGYTFPIFFDTDADGAITYGVSSIPTTYFVGADGSIAAYGIGMLTEESLREGIDMIWSAE